MTDSQKKESKLFTILRDDIGKVDFKRTMRQEFSELKEVMLTEERRERLKAMRGPGRWAAFAWWLMKSMIRKLTPARRLLLVAGLTFLFFGRIEIGTSHEVNLQINLTFAGVMSILFVLGLELKDKLLAHEELSAGRVIQQSLMPEQSPEVAGWQLWLFTRSANEVGGDLIDFFKIYDQRYGIAIGDVAGKGLSAALLSAKLQATLKAVAPDFTSLGLLGSKLNEIYCRDGIRTRFASLEYFEFQPDSGNIRFLNAGHLPPLIVRNGKVTGLEKGGPALGILCDSVYMEADVELNKNDILLAYSDGVSEAQNLSGEFYGDERLIALLPRIVSYPADLVGSTIVAEVDRFIGEARAMDDLSIVILKRTT